MMVKAEIGTIAVALVVAFAAGRWAAPTKVVYHATSVTADKKTESINTDSNQNKHIETKVTQSDSKDGTKVVVTEITEDDETVRAKTSNTSEETQKTETRDKTVIYNSPKVTISALAGLSVHDLSVPSPVYGASVSKQVLGPISAGIWGLSNGVFGLSIGVSL
jgi:hypothetical protein